MITAVDTSVLLDVFTADPNHGESSRQALRRAIREGSLVACEVVWAELAGVFPRPSAAENALHELGVRFDPLQKEQALQAGQIWRAYRTAGGRRDRMIPDFLIGAHALLAADRLLTRDRGYYRAHFGKLKLLEP